MEFDISNSNRLFGEDSETLSHSSLNCQARHYISRMKDMGDIYVFFVILMISIFLGKCTEGDNFPKYVTLFFG